MLTANINEKRVLANEMEDRTLEYLCPFCNDKMILVKGKIKIDHFRHYASKDCESEPETKEHLQGKLFLYDFFSKAYPTELEPKMNGFKPDLLITDRMFKIAIEFQCSPLSMEEFLYRTKRYTENKIYVIWIFGRNNFFKWEGGISYRVRNIEKKAHELYFGRVYYLYQGGLNQKSYIRQLKLRPTTRYVEPTVFGGGYTKFYKKSRCIDIEYIVVSPKLEFKWNTWKGNNYLISIFLNFIPFEWRNINE